MTVPVDLILTDLGYKKMLGRDKTGPHLIVSTFAVAQYATDYTPSTTQVALNGTVLYSGYIETYFTNARNDKIYKCVVPETSVAGTIYEVGLYLESGELFAVGVLPTRYTKTSPFRLMIVARLRAPNDNRSVEFAALDNPIMSVAKDYSNLPAANITGPNAWIVLNGHCGNTRFPQFTPVMVSKWRNGDEWALVNGSIVYRGPILAVDTTEGKWITTGTGTINTDSPELTDVAMLVVHDGVGKYQTRHVQYDSINKRYVLMDAPFLQLPATNGDSQITIWAGPGCCGGSCV